MISPTADFASFFRAATGHEPYDYQRALGESDRLPAVLNVPTGAGKTQVLIVSWLFRRRVHKTGPRRLVYALPMRTLVEQTSDVARSVRESLELDEDELSIQTLMGGLDRSELRDWQRWPERDQILIGTIDMLLSRALNRGYAASRFIWPVPFGLLNNDCRWVFDEVQLMGSARATSAQLDGLRASLGTALPCETIWVSATVDQDALQTIDRPTLGSVMSLSEKDRTGGLAQRLQASKTLRRTDLSGRSGTDLAALAAAAVLEHHVDGTRTLVVLNTVELAQATYRELSRLGVEGTILLHSRFRPPERREHMDRALADPSAGGSIVVATQVVEAGVDMSARTLLTETAPFSSIVQRAGRCNRNGEHEDASVVWLDRGPLQEGSAGQKAAAPYPLNDIERAREQLLELVGESLSPATLEQIDVEEASDDPTVLRRRDLLDLFDTSPDLSGMDIDVAPFIRDDDDRSVAVLFRNLSGEEAEIGGQPAPERDELVQVPRFSLGKRACWTIDHVDGRWVRRTGNEVTSGATVMLRCADGGYSPHLGWDGKAKDTVEPVPLKQPQAPEGVASDPGTDTGHREELLPHLMKVANEAADLIDALGLTEWREVLRCAGALHDLGKAHPVFQKTLRTAMFGDAQPDDGRLWAKSDKPHGGRHERRYFRHELASALAIRQLEGAVELPSRDLVAYLVATHHGKVRLSIRPAPDEVRPSDAASGARFALGIVDGDALPDAQTPVGDIPSLTLDLTPMELGATNSWTDAAVRLRDDPQLGPFRLGFLEALLRVADWRASGA